MNDSNLKNMISTVLRNKGLISDLLDRFDPADIERGFLLISQEILNYDLKMLVMEKAGAFLNDYRVIFDQGNIYLDIDVQAKQLGKIRAKLMLTVKNFIFQENSHRIECNYQEDVKSEGNFMQNMAVKAAGLKGNYLQTAVEFAKLDFIKADKESVVLDLDQINGMDKIPSSFRLNYVSCENGTLKLKFGLNE